MKSLGLISLGFLSFALLASSIFAAEARSSSPLNIDEIADLQDATIQHLEADEAPDRKAGYDFSTLTASENDAFAYCNLNNSPDAITKSGHRIKMLGAALVYFSASNGSSILGHVGERFAFCYDYQYMSGLYEYAPFDPSTWNDGFDTLYGVKRDNFSAEEKKSVFDSIFVLANFQVAKEYDRQQLEMDRTIYEAWIKTDGATMYKMMNFNGARYDEQKAKLQAQQPLPRYKVPSDDCVTPVVQDLQLINPGYISKHSPARLTPSFLYNFVKNHDVDRIVVYPSQREFRILRKRAEGKSTAFTWLLPASKDLSAGLGDSCALVYTQAHGLLRYSLIGPATGVANLVAASGETVYGVVTEPVVLLEKLFQKKNISRQMGAHRVLRGLSDIFDSAAELFSFQIRFPLPDDFTAEEMSFFQNFSQQSLLLKYLGVKYENAPVLVKAPSIN